MVKISSYFVFSQLLNKLFLIFVFFETFRKCVADCDLYHKQSIANISKVNKILDSLKPLYGSVFETKDVFSKEQYTYKIAICGGMENNVGGLQTSENGTHTLGLTNMTEIMGGTDWIYLTYYGGDPYHRGDLHCLSNRKVKLMIVCDPDVLKGQLQILEERKIYNESDCFYLFELGSNVACNPKKDNKEPSKLSSGSVFCILFFTGISVYLICGFLYKRIVIGAKGLEQIPNYSFWRDFGNLQADGCDYFCRCGPRQESQAYRGIDDYLKEEERDDQLLNM